MFEPLEISYALNASGSIMVNNAVNLDPWERYTTAIHEIGHLLGLRHNRNPRSVMFYLDVHQDAVLDRRDLRVLARLHKRYERKPNTSPFGRLNRTMIVASKGLGRRIVHFARV
jgi:hypothetical protein